MIMYVELSSSSHTLLWFGIKWEMIKNRIDFKNTLICTFIVRSSSSFVDVDALVIIYFTLVGSTHIIFLLYELVLHALLSRCSVVAPFASLTPHALTLQKVSCCCCSRCMYLPSLTRCPSVYVVHLLSFSRLFGSGSGLCCVLEMQVDVSLW